MRAGKRNYGNQAANLRSNTYCCDEDTFAIRIYNDTDTLKIIQQTGIDATIYNLAKTIKKIVAGTKPHTSNLLYNFGPTQGDVLQPLPISK